MGWLRPAPLASGEDGMLKKIVRAVESLEPGAPVEGRIRGPLYGRYHVKKESRRWRGDERSTLVKRMAARLQRDKAPD